MDKTFFRLGSIFGALAVMLGAFGAHALKSHLEPAQLDTYHTGVEYQFYHTFALLVVGFLFQNRRKKALLFSGWAFTIGILFFSGSLYLLSAKELIGINLSWLGPVTPLGGLFLIVGWVLLFFGCFERRSRVIVG